MTFKSPFLKAIVPIVIGALLSVVDMLVSGHVDIERLRALAGGIITAVLVYFAPNTRVPSRVDAPPTVQPPS